MFCCSLIVIGVIFVVLYIISQLTKPAIMKLHQAHVLVTGGSSGIGKCIAIEAVKRGANVTLVARNKVKLDEAKKEVEKYKTTDDQKVLCLSADLSKDYTAVEEAIHSAEQQLGPVDMLVNSAGTSYGGAFDDLPISQFQYLMDVNYLGSVYAMRAVLPGMKQRNKGRIVFLSSQAGQIGIFGFTAYSASKFALRGLSEALQMEVKPYNIRVTVAYPPDTDTPGLQEEQKTKPKETKLISETSGLFEAPYVAKKIVNDAVAGRFGSYMGLDGWMLWSATAGGAPVTSLMEAIQQVCTMSLFRVISFGILYQFDRLVQKCKTEREQQRTKSD